MSQNILSQPVGALMRPTLRVFPEDSISGAVIKFRENGGGLLPVTTDDRLCGAVTDRCLARVVGEDIDLSLGIETVMEPAESIAPYATGAEALRKLESASVGSLVVVDDMRRVLGVIGAQDLFPRRRPPIRPAVIGGMASPFGVYLTTGTTSGGVPKWALIGTGAFMSSLLIGGALLANSLAVHIPTSVPAWVTEVFANVIAVGVLLAGMRLAPMSGIHAAEHQVVHAIERGEELRLDVVRRMPRVHPRCGTNVAVGLTIFLTIAFTPWVEEDRLRAIVALLAAFLLWKRVGSLAQFYITTKRPTDKQLEMGIKAGKEVLERYSRAPLARPNPWQWIWASGLLPVLAGSLICGLLVQLLKVCFHVDLGL